MSDYLAVKFSGGIIS